MTEDDEAEFLNVLTDIIIFMFETLSIDELQEYGVTNNVLDIYIKNCRHCNLCAKVFIIEFNMHYVSSQFY